ncbi:MAG TPA: DUF2071 domain-containing protein [Chloroflexota bacterium]|nr:DUF2071 domain-containing protein [Chloroflexota bacterium]
MSQPVVMHQKWRELLFLHWEVPPAALKAQLPRGLDLDLWEGRAFVGLIPFVVTETRARFLPPLPGLSSYYEINTRTYVKCGDESDGESGVWFFALDASNVGVTAGARATFQLPYYPCTAQRRHSPSDGEIVQYRSARLSPGPTPGALEVEYRVHEPIGAAPPGSIDHYFIERYTLFTVMRPMGLMVGQVRHHPYPLHRVELLRLDCETLARSLKLPPPGGDVHAHYSSGVDVEILAPRRPLGYSEPRGAQR